MGIVNVNLLVLSVYEVCMKNRYKCDEIMVVNRGVK